MIANCKTQHTTCVCSLCCSAHDRGHEKSQKVVQVLKGQDSNNQQQGRVATGLGRAGQLQGWAGQDSYRAGQGMNC